jgi:hypothetical protein
MGRMATHATSAVQTVAVRDDVSWVQTGDIRNGKGTSEMGTYNREGEQRRERAREKERAERDL